MDLKVTMVNTSLHIHFMLELQYKTAEFRTRGEVKQHKKQIQVFWNW